MSEMSSVESGESRSRSLGGFGGGEAEREGGRPESRFACLLDFELPVGVFPALRFLLRGLTVGIVALFEVDELLFEPEATPPPDELAVEVDGVGSSAVELLVPRNLALLRVERVIRLDEGR